MKARKAVSGIFFRVLNPETKVWESVAFEDLSTEQQLKVLEDKEIYFCRNLAILLANALNDVTDNCSI